MVKTIKNFHRHWNNRSSPWYTVHAPTTISFRRPCASNHSAHITRLTPAQGLPPMSSLSPHLLISLFTPLFKWRPKHARKTLLCKTQKRDAVCYGEMHKLVSSFWWELAAFAVMCHAGIMTETHSWSHYSSVGINRRHSPRCSDFPFTLKLGERARRVSVTISRMDKKKIKSSTHIQSLVLIVHESEREGAAHWFEVS